MGDELLYVVSTVLLSRIEVMSSNPNNPEEWTIKPVANIADEEF